MDAVQPRLLVDHVAHEHLLGDQDRFVELFSGDGSRFVGDIQRACRIAQEFDVVAAMKGLAGCGIATDLRHVARDADSIDVV